MSLVYYFLGTVYKQLHYHWNAMPNAQLLSPSSINSNSIRIIFANYCTVKLIRISANVILDKTEYDFKT